ncbi:MAG: MYXO-CTERM domain-containing protein [Phycisphaerales bacterium]|jgi:MYXO-CTERM domain-containing protein
MRCYAYVAPLLLAGPLLAQGFSIDDFDSLPNDEIGGDRQVSGFVGVNPFSQPSSFDVFDTFSFAGINGAAIFNSGIGVEQLGNMSWDNQQAGLDLNLAAMGVVGFELDFLQIDQAFEIEIVLESFGFNPDGKARFTTTIGPVTSLTTYAFSIDDFTSDPASGFSFAKVDSFTINFNLRANPTASLDFILTEFRATVPTPGAAALLGLGGLIATRRRR